MRTCRKIIQSILGQKNARVPGSKRIKNFKTNSESNIQIKEELYKKIISLNNQFLIPRKRSDRLLSNSTVVNKPIDKATKHVAIHKITGLVS